MALSLFHLAAIPVFMLPHAVAGVQGSDVVDPVKWMCSDVEPWRSVEDPKTDTCTLLVSVREPRDFICPTCPACSTCPTCPPPAPVIPRVPVSPGFFNLNTKEKERIDLEDTIANICHQIQDHMPLIRPNDTWSTWATLKQEGWHDPTWYDTKVSVKILHHVQPSKSILMSAARLIPIWGQFVDVLAEWGKEGKRDNGIVCDRTYKEETNFDSCVASLRSLWHMKATDRGGYKAWSINCTLYDWEPLWTEYGGWPDAGHQLN